MSGGAYRVCGTERAIPELDLPRQPIYMVKERILDEMIATLKFVDAVLSDHEIDYWITTGTLLGAVRHGGLIPWDDEVDINIRLDDYERLGALRSVIEKAGYRLSESRGGYKIGRHNWLTAFPYVDVIIVDSRDGKLSPCFPLRPDGSPSFEVADQWPGECLPPELVYPLAPGDFEGIRVRGPGRAADTVRQLYGDDAFTSVPDGGAPRFPWLDNHYFDNVAFRLGLIPG